MPKKQLTDSLALDDAAPSPGLAGWQATGLALAVAAMAARAGLGALVGAVLLAPIVYALVRLRRHAPDARSTAELVGSTLGPRGAAFAAVLQLTGYVLVAVTAARVFGLVWVPRQVTDDLFTPVQVNHWLWSLWAVATIVVAAVLALLWGIAAVTEGLDAKASPDAVFVGIVGVMAVLAVVVIQFDWTLGHAARLVLLALYAVVMVANSRIAADSVVTWWLRLVMPVVLAALVLLPLVWAGFSLSALEPVVIAGVLIAAAAAAAILGTRSRPD